MTPFRIDQSQPLNLVLSKPDMKAMSHMYRRAWRAGLKTTDYLRTLGASSIEKSSVARVEPAAAPALPPPRGIVSRGSIRPSRGQGIRSKSGADAQR